MGKEIVIEGIRFKLVKARKNYKCKGNLSGSLKGCGKEIKKGEYYWRCFDFCCPAVGETPLYAWNVVTNI